jgi:glycosyltransferase involved in cell wall biosynthesis
VRILYHHRTAADDGQAVHIRELQGAFRRLGHEVDEVALVKRTPGAVRSKPSILGKLADLAPGFVRELAEHGYDAAGRRALRSAITNKRPDFLYERYALSTACGVEVAKESRLPFVLEVNSPLVDEVARTRGLQFPGWARRKEDRVLRGADVVCVVSGALRDWARSRGVDEERILLTPNGVDLARFHPAAKRADLLASLGIPTKRIIGFTGFMRDWHRLDVALEAFAAARLDRLDAALLIVGDGPALPGLRRKAKDLGIEAHVRFTGQVPHEAIADHVRLFDVALVTAINPYASPLKLFEYLASGVASVVVDQPNLREVLEADCARFVPEGDAKALAAALTGLLTDKSERRRIAEAGRALLLERDYTWDGNARRVVAAVAAVVAERGRARANPNNPSL